MNFTPGKEYRRLALHEEGGGSRQSGISVSARHPVAFLFTGKSGHQYGYEDGFQEDGTFWYTGEGQVGDMKMDRGNAAIRDSGLDGRELHLFEQSRKGHVVYVGRAQFLGHHDSIAPDREGAERKVIVFELAVDADDDGEPTDTEQPDKDGKGGRSAPIEKAWTRPIAELKALAMTAGSKDATPKERKTRVHIRSHAVHIYVRRRADGTCEGCKNPAPFHTSDGHPYLESHHIRRRADGGPDHPRWVAALCPTCHRRAHHSHDATEFNRTLGDVVGAKELS